MDQSEEQRQLDAKARKYAAVSGDETIVFAIRQHPETKDYAVATLENPYMIMASDSKERAVFNAFKEYLSKKYNIDIEIKKSSGDPEVSQ